MRRTWMRAKALLLPVEASLAIGWLVALTSSGPKPDFDPIGDPALRPWLLAASLLAALGLLHAVAGFFGRILRLRNPALLGPAVAGFYLCITQAALVFGLLMGPLAAHGRFRDLAVLSLLSGALMMVSSLLLMALSDLVASGNWNPFDSIPWSFSLFLVGFLPAPLAWFPGQATTVISALTLLTLLSGLLLALRYLPWILHPFTLRHLFDRRLVKGSRAALALPALIALFPLGGVALPDLDLETLWLAGGEGQAARLRDSST